MRALLRRTFAASACAALLSLATLASAVTDCTSGITVAANTTKTLMDNYLSNDGTVPCFTLQNNATLNLNGHTIDRVYTNNVIGPEAVKCVSSSTTVRDGGSPKGVITGETWDVGIKDCETILGVVIDGVNNSITKGIVNTSTVKAKSITDTVVKNVNFGMELVLFDRDSVVLNNVVHASNRDLLVSGTTDGAGPLVQNNILRDAGFFIAKSGTDKIRIVANVMLNRDTGFPGGDCTSIVATGTTFTDNYCDCSDQCAQNPAYTFPWF